MLENFRKENYDFYLKSVSSDPKWINSTMNLIRIDSNFSVIQSQKHQYYQFFTGHQARHSFSQKIDTDSFLDQIKFLNTSTNFIGKKKIMPI